MNGGVRRLAAAGLSLLGETLYPSRVACALCNQEAILNEKKLCPACASSLKPLGVIAAPQPLDGLFAAFSYEGGATAGIHALKYSRQTRLAPFFAEAIEIPPDWSVDCIVPVPLHPLKKWLRTYNQSELIARSLAKRTFLPVNPGLLRRVRFTKTQTTLDEFERAKNVARAFAASPAVKGRNVLLVDDVTTTHSTLLACAVALKQAGAGLVYAACACSAAKSNP